MTGMTQMTLGELAAWGPSARGVLLRHQLDFCCGGRQKLADACSTAGLDSVAIAKELEQTQQTVSGQRDWSEAPLEEVVSEILERFHAPLPAQLDSVVAAAEKVERVHGSKPSHPHGLAAQLRQVRAELTSHMGKEEQVLFPAVVAGHRGATLGGPVAVMMREHDDHGVNLRSLRALCTDFRPPPAACATWRALYEQLEQLEADLMEHIHLENHILFPRALEQRVSS